MHWKHFVVIWPKFLFKTMPKDTHISTSVDRKHLEAPLLWKLFISFALVHYSHIVISTINCKHQQAATSSNKQTVFSVFLTSSINHPSSHSFLGVFILFLCVQVWSFLPFPFHFTEGSSHLSQNQNILMDVSFSKMDPEGRAEGDREAC